MNWNTLFTDSDRVPAVIGSPITTEATAVMLVEVDAANVEDTVAPSPVRVVDCVVGVLEHVAVPDTPNAVTVAEVAVEHDNPPMLTVSEVAERYASETVLEAAIVRVPLATDTDIAGDRMSFNVLPFMKNPVLKDSVVGPSFLTYTVAGKLAVLLERETWSMLNVSVVPPELLVDAPMNPMT